MASIVTKIRKVAAEPTFPVLLALSGVHCLNDALQSVITAVYPMLKDDLSLNFAQIGLITLVYQIASSVFQPVIGYVFDRRPFVRSLPAGMCCTATGIVLFAFAGSLVSVLVAVALVGIGSATLHPEASRITSLASHGRRGMAQSIFQVGGNLGTSVGPLLVAVAVAPYGRSRAAMFVVLALLAMRLMMPICRWYGMWLGERRAQKASGAVHHIPRPLGPAGTWATVGLILVLIFSKYIYMASITSYYTFYLIDAFGLSIQSSQLCLFVFLFATAAGTLVGGPVGDRYGRKTVIVVSLLGTAPFSLLMPHCGLALTVAMSFGAGFMLSSAFPAILLYSQELFPNKLGTVSGMFLGLSFGVAGIASAALGYFADSYGIEAIYRVCAFMPLLGFAAVWLPRLSKSSRPKE
ncbi:MAG: MFS transporter [Muribaculaceae bacterium]|nr:MFS transporter [Muribaculaceae bacterium]